MSSPAGRPTASQVMASAWLKRIKTIPSLTAISNRPLKAYRHAARFQSTLKARFRPTECAEDRHSYRPHFETKPIMIPYRRRFGCALKGCLEPAAPLPEWLALISM